MMSPNIDDRELSKFREASNDKSKVAVTVEDGLLSGVTYTKIVIEYPTQNTEVYKYYNGLVLSAEILLTYTNNSKQYLSSAERL